MSSSGTKIKVVHVSGDFPDPIGGSKTPVIRSLVEMTANDFDHFVYSINREPIGLSALASNIARAAGKPVLQTTAMEFAHGLAVSYRAPSRGVFHKSMLAQLGRDLTARLANHSDQPDLLVAHKLTIEGLVVSEMARLTGLPYALCIQGDTDTKILSARPDLKADFNRLFHSAKVVMPFTPWSLAAVERRLGKRSGPVSLLPCPTDLDQPLAPNMDGRGVVTAFHLKNHRRKNLHRMAEAFRILQREGNAPEFTIIGGGDHADRAASEALTAGIDKAKLIGARDRNEVRTLFNQAKAFLLSSLRESFGLVFVEALFAGTPVIYPKGAAIDGYFDGKPFAIPVDARSASSIADGIRYAVENERELKNALLDWQSSADANRFQRSCIGRTFAEGLSSAIS